MSGVPQEVPPSKEMIQHYRAETDDDDQKQAHIQVKYFFVVLFLTGLFLHPSFSRNREGALHAQSLISPHTGKRPSDCYSKKVVSTGIRLVVQWRVYTYTDDKINIKGHQRGRCIIIE